VKNSTRAYILYENGGRRSEQALIPKKARLARKFILKNKHDIDEACPTKAIQAGNPDGLRARGSSVLWVVGDASL